MALPGDDRRLDPDADVIVVGAGAAGLWAAAAAARAGVRVVVLEKTPRAGSKVLASGGTRCNLTTTLDADEAARLFGDGARFVTPAMRALPPDAVVARFHALGVPTVTEPALEKVFPASQRAIDVRDALLRQAAGARIVFGAGVRGIEPAADGWVVRGTRDWRARAVILAVGGRSYPKTGTTGDGYDWLAALDLPVVAPVPALVPLTSDAAWVTALSGIALQEVEARLHDPSGRIVARRARPVLFTHHGLSGPGAMDLSAPIARGGAGWTIALDLMPGTPLEAVQGALRDAAERPGAPHLARIAPGLPARLVAAVARQAGLTDENPALNRVERKARNRLADALKGLVVPISGTLGWDQAEVTAGGLALGAVDRTTMAVRGRPGLFVCGELLDLDGPIGGLNFQAAFATGELAGVAAARG